MPPKPESTIVKFKRSRSTYTVLLVLNQKKSLTIDYFKDELVHAINSSGGLRLEEPRPIDGILPEDEGVQVAAEDIELAFPKTRDTPYDGEWIPIQDDLAVETILLNDYDIIGFKFSDDPGFAIEEPVYEEA